MRSDLRHSLHAHFLHCLPYLTTLRLTAILCDSVPCAQPSISLGLSLFQSAAHSAHPQLNPAPGSVPPEVGLACSHCSWLASGFPHLIVVCGSAGSTLR